MLAALFGLLVCASSVVLWRSISKNQAAHRYLSPPKTSEPVLAAKELGPERWSVIAPLRTLRRVIHGEIGGLAYGSSTVVTASVAVNAELQHWFAVERPRRLSPELSKELDVLARQIEVLWEQGHWGGKGTLDAELFGSRLRSVEALLASAEAQISKPSSPYR